MTSPPTYSYQGQDEFVVAHLKGLRGGFFVDSGASDGVSGSNTKCEGIRCPLRLGKPQMRRSHCEGKILAGSRQKDTTTQFVRGHSYSIIARQKFFATSPRSFRSTWLGGAFLHDLLRDLRHTFRRLRRTPGFTAATLLTLALGIGANTAIFSVIDGVLLKPLPFPEPERLIGVWQSAPGVNIKDLNASLADYIAYREDSKTFAALPMTVPRCGESVRRPLVTNS